MEIFIFSINAIMPVILITALGWFMRYKGVIGAGFIPMLNKLCYNVLLPVMLFGNIYVIDFRTEFHPQLAGYSSLMLILILAVLWLVLPRWMRDRQILAATLNATFRSNFVIYAVPVISAMFGPPGVRAVSMLIPIAISMFNIFGVIILRYYSNQKQGSSSDALRAVLVDIARNPLVIASVAGIIASLLNVITYLPGFVVGAVSSVGSAGTPMGLILMGAQLNLHVLQNNKGAVAAACLIKLVLVPAAVLIPTVLLGFRGVELGVLLLLFGAPSPVGSAIMARGYDIAPEYAAQLVVATTILSSVTLFAIISILRTLSLL